MGPAEIRDKPPGPPRYATRGKRANEPTGGKSSSVEGLIPDSQLNDAERPKQPLFIKWLFLVPFLLVLKRDGPDEYPNRTPRPAAVAMVRADPLPVPSPAPGAARMGGLWQLTSAEPRFGGLSALAIDRGRLLTVTDSGALVRWHLPGGDARVRDLPAGPGLPQWKLNRDSEALARDPAGRGWWVSFEQQHSLYLFDRSFSRALIRRPLRLRTWWRNWGAEALATEGASLLVLPENGGELIRLSGRREERLPLRWRGQVADAATLKDGRVAIAMRELRPWGISNRLAWLRPDGAGYRIEPWATLPLGRWDNVEGLAAEPLPNGANRLWFVTDNDFGRRTLLGWILIGPDTQKGAPALDRNPL